MSYSAIACEAENLLRVSIRALADQAQAFEDGLAGYRYSPRFLASVLEGRESLDDALGYRPVFHGVYGQDAAMFFHSVVSIARGIVSDQALEASAMGIVMIACPFERNSIPLSVTVPTFAACIPSLLNEPRILAVFLGLVSSTNRDLDSENSKLSTLLVLLGTL